jgi:hypothetical protein
MKENIQRGNKRLKSRFLPLYLYSGRSLSRLNALKTRVSIPASTINLLVYIPSCLPVHIYLLYIKNYT